MTTPGLDTEPPKRNILWKTLIPIAGIIIVIFVVLSALKSSMRNSAKPQMQPESASHVEVGATVPDFSLSPFGGKQAIKLSQLGAKVILLNFWATWCDACVIEMPSLVKLHDAYQGKGLEVVLVNVEDNPAAVLPRALREFGIKFPVYADPEGKAAAFFDVHGLPFTVILGKNRSILSLEDGERDWNATDVRQAMDRWLTQ